MPTDLLNEPVVASQRFILALGLVSMAVAIGLAFLVGRNMIRRVDYIARSALAVGDGREPPLDASNVREFDMVSQSLTAAYRLISSREAALRGSEARLRAIVDTAADAIIVIDEHGRIQTVNPAAERIFGHAAAAIVGSNVATLMAEPDAPRSSA